MRSALLCLIGLAAAAPASAEWRLIGPYTQVDPVSVRPDADAGGFTLLVRHFDLGKGGLPPPLDSTVAHMHFDCRARQGIQLDIIYYDAQGKVIGGGPANNGPPALARPGSVFATIEDLYCPKG